MDLDNHVQTIKLDPHNANSLGRSKLLSSFSPWAKFIKLIHMHRGGKGRTVCNAVFRSTISCIVTDILEMNLQSCPKLGPNFDVFSCLEVGPNFDLFWPPNVSFEGPQISDPIL